MLMSVFDFPLCYIERRQPAVLSLGEIKKIPTPVTIIADGSCIAHRKNCQ